LGGRYVACKRRIQVVFVKLLFLLDYFVGHRRQAGKPGNKKGEASPPPFLCDKPS
jgi:hypothetical protein